MSMIADLLNRRPLLQRRLFFLARRFVSGESVASAIEAAQRLNAAGLSATLDFLGEDVEREVEAARTTGAYLETLGAIDAAGVDANVSLKLSAIGQLISEDLAFANLRRIIAKARLRNVFVRLDMEGSATVDSTYRIIDRALGEYQHVGPVIQAYLHRAPADAERQIARGIRVRLCKGAYREPPEVALQKMPQIRQRFMQIAERLLACGRYPGIATHDDYLIDAVKAFTGREKIGLDRFEFQMLYGVRPAKQQAIAREGYRMRVYVPFGTHWAAYFYRRLAERRENALFVARSLFEK